MGSLLLGIPAAGRAVQGYGAYTAAVPGLPHSPDVRHLLRTPCALGPAPPTPSLASCRSCAFSTDQDFQGLHRCLPSLSRPGIHLHFFNKDLILPPSAVALTSCYPTVFSLVESVEIF